MDWQLSGIDDISRLVYLKAASLSGTPSVSPSGSGPGVLRVMEDRLSMPMPTPYSGACQPMGPTTSPNAAVAALVQFTSRGAFRAPQEAPRGAKRHREGEEQEEDRAPTEKRFRWEALWVAPTAAARRHFTHYVLNNMVYRVATHAREAVDFAAGSARVRNPGRAVVPMVFRRLSSGASVGLGGRCPCAKPSFFCGASELPWTSTQIIRSGLESLSLVLASRNRDAW
jgi:hypothetical protein